MIPIAKVKYTLRKSFTASTTVKFINLEDQSIAFKEKIIEQTVFEHMKYNNTSLISSHHFWKSFTRHDIDTLMLIFTMI